MMMLDINTEEELFRNIEDNEWLEGLDLNLLGNISKNDDDEMNDDEISESVEDDFDYYFD